MIGFEQTRVVQLSQGLRQTGCADGRKHVGQQEFVEPDGFIVDTHGADVIDPVWELLEQAYRHFGPFPTLLERDFNIPPLDRLLSEVDIIAAMQTRHLPNERRRMVYA